MGRNHIRVYNELDDVDLVAVADSSERALSATTARGYQDYRRLLEEEAIDAVSIAVPARSHYEVALACIDRGIASLIEKPIAASTAEGEALRASAERSNVPLMVGHVERFNPAVLELKGQLTSGRSRQNIRGKRAPRGTVLPTGARYRRSARSRHP